MTTSYERIAMSGWTPLVVARGAIDKVCKEKEKAVRIQLREGECIDNLLAAPIDEPLVSAATLLLDASLQSGDHTWTDWFHLQTRLATMKQRIFSRLLFSNKETYAAQRRLIHTDAYRTYGSILEQASGLQSCVAGSRDRNQIRGSEGELAALALLTKTNPSHSGAQMSSALADQLYRVDEHYYCFDPATGSSRAVNLQIKTYSETGVLPNKILQFGIFSLLQDRQNGSETINLIIRDIHDDLNPSEQKDLVERAGLVKSTIHNILNEGALGPA